MMSNLAGRIGVGAICGLLAMTPAVASAQQSSGGIAGSVKDTTGALMPGVTVEATSPALIERTRTVVTDVSGEYRFVDLRPGVYEITFSLEGFSSVRRSDIEITAGFTATVNGELRVGALQETITVSGASPVVDVQNHAQQSVMTRDVIETLPTAKGFNNLANLVPGMVLGGSTPITQDVGGQAGQGFVRAAIHGGAILDQQLLLDGFALTNLSTDGASTNAVPVIENVEQYIMETSAHPAEAETGGVRINVVPKSGGNTFHGSVFGNFSDAALQSNNYTDALKNQGLKSQNRLKDIWALSGGIGGPIAQNKVWFFSSGQRTITDNYVANLYENTNIQGWTYVPDLTKQMVFDQHQWAAQSRFTWQATPRNKLDVSYEYNYLCNCHFAGASSTIAPEGTTLATFNNHVIQGTWTTPVTSKLLLQGGGSLYWVDPWNLNEQPFASSHPITESSNGVVYSAAPTASYINSQTINFKGSAAYVTGTHSVKIGMDMRLGNSAPNASYTPNNISYTFLNQTPSSVTYSSGPILQTSYIRPNLGVFAQDQWTRKRLTINAGLRFDWFRTSYPDETTPTPQTLKGGFVIGSSTYLQGGPLSFPGANVLNWKDLDPRVGFAYDVFGNSKTAFKMSLSRYVVQQALALTNSLNPITLTASKQTRTWKDPNGDRIIQGDPLNPAANEELGPTSNVNFGKPVITTSIDPKFAKGFEVRPYDWEFSTGVQQEVFPRLSVNGTYVRRWYGNFQVTDNLAYSPSDYTHYCVPAPVDARLPGGGGYNVCDLYDVDPAKVGQVNNLITSSSNFGAQIQHWNGVDLSANGYLPHKALIQGGVSVGKTLADNCAVVSSNPQITDPNIIGSTGLPTQFCHQETPYLASVKIAGSYPLPANLLLAVTVQSNPAPLYTATYTATNAVIFPSLGRNLASGANGTAAINLISPGSLYGDRQNQLDLRLGSHFKWGAQKIEAFIDLYNALNDNTVLTANVNYGTNGASWLVPTTILPARVLKFEVRTSF
jgi:hypothetical protein